MSNRSRAKKIQAKGPCRVYWGSHGCSKQLGHIGFHFCARGCWIPDETTTLYGEHAYIGDQRVLRSDDPRRLVNA